jgi:hypothetical protein
MSKAVNNLSYTGIVTLSQYNKRKKVPILTAYNSGGFHLFNFLADCLIGDFNTAALDRPNKILLLNIEDDEATQTRTMSRLSGFIYSMTVEKVYDKDSMVVRYSFIVPRDYLSDSQFNGFGLYTDSVSENNFINSYAAICKLNTFNSNMISDSSVLVVDWELIISNNHNENVEVEF